MKQSVDLTAVCGIFSSELNQLYCSTLVYPGALNTSSLTRHLVAIKHVHILVQPRGWPAKMMALLPRATGRLCSWVAEITGEERSSLHVVCSGDYDSISQPIIFTDSMNTPC